MPYWVCFYCSVICQMFLYFHNSVQHIFKNRAALIFCRDCLGKQEQHRSHFPPVLASTSVSASGFLAMLTHRV